MSIHTCTHNGVTYDVAKLIELSKDLPIQKLKVEDLRHNLEQKSWSDSTKNKEVNISAIETYNRRYENEGFMGHVTRAMNADLNCPIIMSNDINAISDGMHRLLKAYILNKKYINAVVFETLPVEAIVK